LYHARGNTTGANSGSIRSLRNFMLQVPLLGILNAVAVVVIESLVGDLATENTSVIAIFLYTDLVMSVVMFFFETPLTGLINRIYDPLVGALRWTRKFPTFSG
jgi:hypothetical protein